MIRRPPRSTLFPYTDALPIYSRERRPRRRGRERGGEPGRRGAQAGGHHRGGRGGGGEGPSGRLRAGGDQGRRSEEHTSELQLRQYLVCRLLLEKKTVCRQSAR